MSYLLRVHASCAAAYLLVLANPQFALAQRGYGRPAATEDGIFACCSGAAIILPIAFLVLNIALLVWVNKDAKARGMESPVVWMLVVLFTSFIGLIIYLLSRPRGDLAPCRRCGLKKLPILSKCPHCGAAV